MDWHAIAADVAKAAPIIGTLLGGPAGAAIGTLVSSALGVGDNAEAVANAVKNDPQAALKLKQLELDHAKDMQTLAIQAEQNRLTADTQRTLAVNQTMQAELASANRFAADWRPVTGYTMSVCFAGIAFVLCWTLFNDPKQADAVMGGFMWLLGTMGAVMGVSVHSSSNDRQVAAGMKPVGILGGLGAKVK